MNTALNGRPHHTHHRAVCTDNPDLHADHQDFSICAICGCCWGCDDDCCSEYVCPNIDCGCNAKAQPTRDLPPAAGGES